jgi:hypothetical protein
MSRTTFNLKFKETVGVSPMDYLTRWRMLLASDAREFERSDFSDRRSFGFRIRKRLQHSIQPWAVRHGNTAVAGVGLPLHMARATTPAPIGSNLSPVDTRGWWLDNAISPAIRRNLAQ